MKRFIATERNGIYIIDLQQSGLHQQRLRVRQGDRRPRRHHHVRRHQEAGPGPIAEQATRVGMPYVNHRWLGGMLTNFQTISKRLTRLKELELNYDDVAASGYTKKELLIFKRERDKLGRPSAASATMVRGPLGRLDRRHKEGAPGGRRGRSSACRSSAILDTNCDPDEVDYRSPATTTPSARSALLTRVIADAVADGSLAQRRQNRG